MATADEGRRRPLGRAGLAVVSRNQGGDGIAYVARLLVRACTDLCECEPRLVELAPAAPRRVSLAQRTRFFLRLAAEVPRGRPSWWLFNHVGIAQAQAWIPPFLRLPYGVFLNGIEVWDPALSPARLSALSRARVRIAISHFTARRFTEMHPEVGPVVPCLLGLLPEGPAPVGTPDRELLDRVGPRSVLIVGRMSASERYKGHDQLIDCWPLVRERVPDARLVVVGSGDDVERLRHEAASRGLGDSVLFTGFVSDATLDALLHRAAAFAMPSRGEGFGLVYLQAMRAGIPCIGSTVDAARDVIVDGETGFLVDPDEPRALAASVTRLLEEPELRGDLGERGRRRYLREFTYERFLGRLSGVLHESFATSGRGER